MVRRLKWFSVSTLVVTGVATPALFLYDHPKWSNAAKAGFMAGIVASSLASSAAFHLVAGRYVLRVVLPATGSATGLIDRHTRIALTTMSFWGLERVTECALQDLQSVERGLCTWKHATTNRSFFLALPRPTDPDSNRQLMDVVRVLKDEP